MKAVFSLAFLVRVEVWLVLHVAMVGKCFRGISGQEFLHARGVTLCREPMCQGLKKGGREEAGLGEQKKALRKGGNRQSRSSVALCDACILRDDEIRTEGKFVDLQI